MDEPSKYGVVIMDETTGKVERFVEKPVADLEKFVMRGNFFN